MELRRVVGPPGCGKTHWLARQCRKAVERYGSQAALVLSLTKAAAREAGTRDTGLDDGMVGTLHAHCYRALGRPPLVTRAQVEEWNKLHPELELSLDDFPARKDEVHVEATGGGGAAGDALFKAAEHYRHARTPVEAWTRTDVAAFHLAWEEFKGSIGAIDFTDMIELALDDVPLPPGSPSVIFADEAQDLSRLELALLERWMRRVEHVVLVGDPDQALFAFRGSAPDILSGDRFLVLGQSYRVPRAVHTVALRLIEEARHRQPVEYQPRDEPGWTMRGAGSLAQAGRAVAEVQELVDRGYTVMVLASSGDQVSRVERELRRQGVPYRNPYTTRWNPLSGGSGISTARRILAFFRADSAEDVKLFAPLLRSGDALKRGAKTRLEELPDTLPEDEVITLLRTEIFTDEAFRVIFGGGISEADQAAWLRANLLSDRAKVVEFPLTILERRGRHALEEQPRVTLGTVHSVKGGEADVVYLFPDLSRAFYGAYHEDSWAGRDAVLRMFYVAVTRAKEGLVVAQPATGMAVQELAA